MLSGRKDGIGAETGEGDRLNVRRPLPFASDVPARAVEAEALWASSFSESVSESDDDEEDEDSSDGSEGSGTVGAVVDAASPSELDSDDDSEEEKSTGFRFLFLLFRSVAVPLRLGAMGCMWKFYRGYLGAV